MRVEEILRFVAPFYPTWDHELALTYVRDFEVPLQTKIKHLSKGKNVRLGLVLALAHRPELVILDDPALGLDPIMRKQFNRDLITHLQGEERTVFTVRICSIRLNPWLIRWPFCTKAASYGKAQPRCCAAM